MIIQPAIVVGFSPKTKKEDGFFNSLLGSINEEKPAKHEMTRKSQLTYVGPICEIINIIIEKNIWGQTIPVAVSEEKSKYDIAKDILSPFGIAVEGIEDPAPKKEPTKLLKLQELNLPIYTYEQVIQKTIEEIKNPQQFVIKS